MSLQFPLEFEFQANTGFDSFYSGTNTIVIDELHALISGNGERQIFLYGDEGYGKSHLLQACCQLAAQQDISPFYFAFHPQRLPTLDLFDGLESMPFICFDDIDNIAGFLDLEQAFLNFYVQHLENNYRLILSAHTHPEEIAMKLPELRKCFRNGLALQLKPLAEDESVSALICKARHIGLEITPKVGHFLLAHYANDLPSLWILLGQLDKATLAAQHKLTIPFLKKILEG